ncbi:hypothetical protein VNO78_03151 [Psophocarpus tetragonolobus]|uniref:Uncharacterized protein n=1 Tax=Psophocarpus tetragonolobus TaxID=3891 RepID=A0AAN9T2L4_PSOTE
MTNIRKQLIGYSLVWPSIVYYHYHTLLFDIFMAKVSLIMLVSGSSFKQSAGDAGFVECTHYVFLILKLTCRIK